MFENKDILEMLNADREKGIKMLFDTYYRPLVLFANEMVNDVGISEDIVQDLFVKLWQGNYLLKISSAALSSYLYSSVRNICRSKLVKRDVLNESDRFNCISGFNEFDNPVDEIYSVTEEKISRVERAFLSLPDQTRNVVEAVIVKELKYKEAAEELDISINTVKTLLQRGIRKLRDKIRVGV